MDELAGGSYCRVFCQFTRRDSYYSCLFRNVSGYDRTCADRRSRSYRQILENLGARANKNFVSYHDSTGDIRSRIYHRSSTDVTLMSDGCAEVTQRERLKYKMHRGNAPRPHKNSFA